MNWKEKEIEKSKKKHTILQKKEGNWKIKNYNDKGKKKVKVQETERQRERR